MSYSWSLFEMKVHYNHVVSGASPFSESADNAHK